MADTRRYIGRTNLGCQHISTLLLLTVLRSAFTLISCEFGWTIAYTEIIERQKLLRERTWLVPTSFGWLTKLPTDYLQATCKLPTRYLQATYMACKVDYQTCFLDIRWLIHEQNLLARSCPKKVRNI